MEFYLEYNLELSEESDYEYYVVHYKKDNKDNYLYNKNEGYVMLKLVDKEYKLLSVPKSNEEELKEFLELLNKKEFKK